MDYEECQAKNGPYASGVNNHVPASPSSRYVPGDFIETLVSEPIIVSDLLRGYSGRGVKTVKPSSLSGWEDCVFS